MYWLTNGLILASLTEIRWRLKVIFILIFVMVKNVIHFTISFYVYECFVSMYIHAPSAGSNLQKSEDAIIVPEAIVINSS